MTSVPVITDSGLLNPFDSFQGIYETDPHFYQLFKGVGDHRLVTAVELLATDASSDFYQPILARIDQRVLGFLYAYPLKEIFSRQAYSLRRFISLTESPRSLRPALANLASSKGKFINQNSYYLSRVYVMPNERGMNVGKLMMDFYEAKANAQGMTSLSLHVRIENVRAQSFYTRLGFEFSDRFASGYLSMEKAI